jgi:hypothetical protein
MYFRVSVRRPASYALFPEPSVFLLGRDKPGTAKWNLYSAGLRSVYKRHVQDPDVNNGLHLTRIIALELTHP